MNKQRGRVPGMNVYSNLVARRKGKSEAKARQKAEYLASLPKQPLQRLLYRLHPKRIFHYWFSRKGAMMALKLAGVCFVILGITIAALFAYYRRELDAIKPGELAKRVQTSVTRYYDRNGVLLWEDKGDGNYRLVVDSGDISNYMKQATVAIEDKDFYKHPGVSMSGTFRAVFTNVSGGNTQGGSTLTQQLVKQVFFSSESQDRGLGGIPRKIKEIILALEVERMYNKDQILSLYLNESPYGGRRNGVESAARTYFGKSAKDLNLSESALLAAIPQNPSMYNPYNANYNTLLIKRQQQVLDAMVEQGNITAKESADAKKVAILDTIKPEISSTENIKAPHFVLEVRSQLEKEFGQKLVREGGLTVKTTLDYRMQEIAEKSVNDTYDKYLADGRNINGADNLALTSVDVATGQVLAMVGSHDFKNEEYGAVNAATALLQPGSSIKVFDYGQLFAQRPGTNYGPGSVLPDKDITSIYKSKLYNYDGRFFGNITIREALGNSRNPPAVEAAYISGIDNVINLARDMGEHSYCIGEDYGLSAAIGGCHVRQVEHVNAYASIARGGVYKQESYIIEVKNAQGGSLKQWKDESKRVMDPQVAYMISDILTDPTARQRVFGANPIGENVSGVKTATKTGTTDDGNGHAKDNWMMSYSTTIATGLWMGRHDGGPLRAIAGPIPGTVINDYMGRVHKELLVSDGKYKVGDWFSKPAGIQTITVNGHRDIWPSWYVKPKDAEGTKMTFDKVSKKKATSCTPDAAKVEVTVQSFTDPITNKKTMSAADGYDPNSDDDRHKCEDVKPFVTLSVQQEGTTSKYKVTAVVNKGTFDLESVKITSDGQVISDQAVSGGSTVSVDYTFPAAGAKTFVATVTDQGYYSASDTRTITYLVASASSRVAGTSYSPLYVGSTAMPVDRPKPRSITRWNPTVEFLL
jgi:membrane peptidoglycan carboxypeptidase